MILAVDLGSTSFKAAVYDRRLTLLGRGSASLAYVYGRHGQVELEPAVCDRAAARAVKQALASARIAPTSLSAVSVTSQAQTFAVLSPGGRLKTRFLSWQDERSFRQAQALSRRRGLADFAAHSSFREILGALQLAQVARLQEEHPGLIRPADRLLHLPTYYIWRWCGPAVMDANLAAMSGLYSLRLGGWWPAALRACGVRADQLAEVRPVGSVGAVTAPEARAFGLAQGIPVVLAGNDQTAGAYGARLHESGRALMTLGTAHVLYVCQAKPARPGTAMIRGPYPGGRFYQMAADGCGGNVVNWAAQTLGLSLDDFFEQAARAPDGCQGLIFNPELPSGAGAWTGLGLRHTRADLARSVLEALVRRLVGMARAAGLRPGSRAGLALAGGGSRRPIWKDLLSRALGLRVEPAEGEPLTGAAAMARAALSET